MQSPEEIAEKQMRAARLSKATYLNLSGLGLTELSASVGKLTELRHLKISAKNLTSLPKTLARLTQLERLEIDGQGDKLHVGPAKQTVLTKAAMQPVLGSTRFFQSFAGGVGISGLGLFTGG